MDPQKGTPQLLLKMMDLIQESLVPVQTGEVPADHDGEIPSTSTANQAAPAAATVHPEEDHQITGKYQKLARRKK